MSFVLDLPRLGKLTPEEVTARWNAYREYIHSIRERLGPGAFAYVTSEFHSDHSSRMSPHDGWVEFVEIRESGSGERGAQRTIRVMIDLLGSYHDGRIRFTYPEVHSYLMNTPHDFEGPPLRAGHGDWLIDEVGLSENGLVVHEILFSRGARWRIESSDLHYEWLPFER